MGEIPAAPALVVNVLGPVSAMSMGRPVPLNGRRQLGVLAVLVAARPEPATARRLLDDVWADAPGTAVSAVEYQVSRLRSLLDPDRSGGVLMHGSTGYRLRLEGPAVDADRFAELARRGRQRLRAGDPAAAVAELDAALGLVRGRPYDGADELAVLAPEIARLNELVVGAREDRLRGWQLLGRHAEVIDGAQRLTAEHPWREAGWGLLATSLAAEGRQADALRAIATVRRILADELGLDPGPELVEVERAVLAHEVRPAVRDRLSPSTLPAVATTLMGRDALIGQVNRLLDENRLVTLTGPGGVGKTRVAVSVAMAWSEPTFYVELAPYDDPTLLVPLIAERAGLIGVQDVPGLVHALSERDLLLVLDNGEHLVEELAGLASPLLRAPGLRLLLTSREPLDMPGETIVDVPPLSSAAAVDLFTARAVAQPGWDVDADPQVIRRICEELDRLPLALELAAARLRVLSVTELAEGLDQRFEVLTDGHRGAPRHQQGLTRTVAWSVDAAPAGEQQLLGVLSVFPGSFEFADVSAITALLGDGQPRSRAALLSRLAGLVRRSLVTAEPGTSPRRYRLLITIRAFARGRLSDDEWSALQRSYLRHVRTVTRSLSRLVEGAAASEALSTLRRTEPDHLAALGIARDLEDGEALLELVGALGWAWYRGATLAGIRWARLALGSTDHPEGASTAPVSERGPAWFTLGRLLYLSGDAGAARDALAQAVRCAVEGRVPELEAQAAVWLAHLTPFAESPAAGVRAARQALTDAIDSAAYPYVIAEATMVLGLALRAAGEVSAAREALGRAVELAEAAGHCWAGVSSSWALMKLDRDAGRLDSALAAATAMTEPLAQDGDVSSWLVLMHTTAAVLAQAGMTREAVDLATDLRRRMRETGFDPERMDPIDGPAEAALIRAAVAASDPRASSSPNPSVVQLLRRLQLESSG